MIRNTSIAARSVALPALFVLQKESNLLNQTVILKVAMFSNLRRKRNVKHLKFEMIILGWRLRQMAPFEWRRSGITKSLDQKKPLTSGSSLLIKDTTVRNPKLLKIRRILFQLNLISFFLSFMNTQSLTWIWHKSPSKTMNKQVEWNVSKHLFYDDTFRPACPPRFLSSFTTKSS